MNWSRCGLVALLCSVGVAQSVREAEELDARGNAAMERFHREAQSLARMDHPRGPPERGSHMRSLHRCGLAVVCATLTAGIFACSERPRGASDTSDAAADTMTTPTMRRELSSDLRTAEQALQRVEDSVDVTLGPDDAIRLRPLKEAFLTYRKQQCDRLKAVFKDGTYGPVAELECLIHLTDSRREFIEQNYDFIEKIGDSSGGNGRAKGARGVTRPALHLSCFHRGTVSTVTGGTASPVGAFSGVNSPCQKPNP